jgi:hypothetical protein
MYGGLSIIDDNELNKHSTKLNSHVNKINKKPTLKINKSKNINN